MFKTELQFKTANSWWRHQMEKFSTLLALCAGKSPVIGEFPTQRPVTRSFEVFFDLRLNKRLNKQSWSWLFDTPSRSLWRNCNELPFSHMILARVFIFQKWLTSPFRNDGGEYQGGCASAAFCILLSCIEPYTKGGDIMTNTTGWIYLSVLVSETNGIGYDLVNICMRLVCQPDSWNLTGTA